MEIEVVSKLSRFQLDTKGKKLNLVKAFAVLKQNNINSYFDEMFQQGLFVKMPYGTYCFFSSGKGIVRGNYSEFDVSTFLRFFQSEIANNCLE